MLTIHGTASQNYCDGISRRNFLKIGGLVFGGLTLPQLLRAEALAGSRSTGKSVINIFLNGGPSHLDTFELKPAAPVEIRGEFQPIATRVPGFEICELMPKLAAVSDRFSVIRSITGLGPEHTSRQSDTGWPTRSLESIGGRPGVGAVLSKLWGPAQQTSQGVTPTAVDLCRSTRYNSKPGFLGQVHTPFRPDKQGLANLSLDKSVTMDRMGDRRHLLTQLDGLRSEVESSGMMSAMDSFTHRALDLVASGHLADALDVTREDPRLVERYGRDRLCNGGDFLVARRLISSGVRCVSLGVNGWDSHNNNADRLRGLVPQLDRALSALIEDLHVQGMLDDVIIMMSGEFGRTPRINSRGGRDHWPRASFFFLAGGGMTHGQAIGSTNRLGEVPQDRPTHLQNVFSTMYHKLGIDPNSTTIIDPNGRPQYLVDHRETIAELV